MSIKSKVLSAAAATALLGGIGVAAAGAASAATPSCGPSCPDVFSREFGTHARPNFVLDVQRGSARPGAKLILWRVSDSDAAEDFTYSLQGHTSDFYAAGLVSAAVNLHYGSQIAVEEEYAPFGEDTGLCVGLASTAVSGEGVTLQPCGVSARTVWIIDATDSPATLAHRYVPLINGSDTNFSHPFVLAYPKNGFPTDSPRPQLKVVNLTGFSNGHGPVVGTVPDTQLWGADFGILP